MEITYLSHYILMIYDVRNYSYAFNNHETGIVPRSFSEFYHDEKLKKIQIRYIYFLNINLNWLIFI